MNWQRLRPTGWIDWTLLLVGLPLLVWDIFSKNESSGVASSLILILIGIQAYQRSNTAEKKELKMIGTGIGIVALLLLVLMLFTNI